MNKEKLVNRLAIGGIVVVLIFSLTLCYVPNLLTKALNQEAQQYESTLFQKNSIMNIQISIPKEDWADMLANATAEEYYSCDVSINGVTYTNVGIRPKGNTSLLQVASDNTTDRFSFKLEFDHYVKGQTCDGLDKLVLNNLMSDATYCKEYITYDMLQYLGVASSLFSYANIDVNGESWGLYLALEAIEESFANRCYGTSYGNLYKPDGLDMENKAGNLKESVLDSAVFDVTQEDKKRLIASLKNITEGTNIEECIDIDAMLLYIIANVFVVNDDSYFANMAHNYYLYEKDGKVTMLPWDYNLAFGGFFQSDATDLVNRPIDTVLNGVSDEQRPLISQIMSVKEYKEQYHNYMDQFIREYFESGYFKERMTQIDTLIYDYVKNDPTAFYSYEEYVTAKEELLEFCMLRAKSIRGQLDGSIPSTKEGQQADSAALIDASGVNISAMGTQGGGKKDMPMPDQQEMKYGPMGFDIPKNANEAAMTRPKQPDHMQGQDMNRMPDSEVRINQSIDIKAIILLIVCIVGMIAITYLVSKFRRRKYKAA